MNKLFLSAFFVAFAFSANAKELKVTVEGIENGKPIPSKYVFCSNDATRKNSAGENISPKITWEKGPEGTKSYAVVVVDRDVPTVFDDADKPGKTLDEHMPRQNFYHWILVNIPVNITTIPEGHGKEKDYGDQLVNDYLKFSGEPKNFMTTSKYTGYDGPCPPTNDARIHNYHYKVYALSEKFTTGGDTDGDQIIRTMTPFILAEGSVIGTYTRNQKLILPLYLKEGEKASEKPEAKPEAKN